MTGVQTCALPIYVLRPAKVEKVVLISDEKAAIAIVPDYQLSLAIGKEGQNVRLAAKVSGWKIDIKSHMQYYGDEDCENEEAEFAESSEIQIDIETNDEIEGAEA